MILDVTAKTPGDDIRSRGGTVYLQPEVSEVQYHRRGSRAVDIVRGRRDKIAAVLRDNGYTVAWLDSNPAVVMGGKTSTAKAEAARKNGLKGGLNFKHGRKREVKR